MNGKSIPWNETFSSHVLCYVVRHSSLLPGMFVLSIRKYVYFLLFTILNGPPPPKSGKVHSAFL